MTKDDLTAEALSKIFEGLYPGLNYLVRLKERMEAQGFPRDDKFYKAVCEAYEASWRLRMDVHYMAVDARR